MHEVRSKKHAAAIFAHSGRLSGSTSSWQLAMALGHATIVPPLADISMSGQLAVTPDPDQGVSL